MKFYWIGIILILAFTSCKQKDAFSEIAEMPVKDTLNLPHFPYLNYDETFLNSPVKQGDVQEEIGFIKKFFDDYWGSNDVSAGLLVAKNGQIIFEGYRGYTNTDTQKPITAETPIHIASISKVLTALATLKLIEAKKISLSDKVSSYLEGFPYEEITVQDLLTHRSGLPNYEYFPHDPEYWDTEKIQTNQTILQALNHKVSVPYNQPNRAFAYSNTNFALLALIIEKVTGIDYPTAMKYIVFDPLQMKNTFVFNIKDSAKVSQSYGFKGKKWDFNYLDQIYGDKNIYSTPRDLLQMDKAMYAKKFLSEKLMRLMKQGYSYEAKGVKNYGLGMRMMEYDNGEKLLYHNGWWHGNYTTYARAEKEKVTVIALGNKQSRAIYSAFSIAGLFGNYPMEKPKNEPDADSLQMAEDSIMLALNEIKIRNEFVKDSLRLEKLKKQEEKKAKKRDSAQVTNLPIPKPVIPKDTIAIPKRTKKQN